MTAENQLLRYRIVRSNGWISILAVVLLSFAAETIQGQQQVARPKVGDTPIEQTMAKFLDAAAGRNKQFRTRVVLEAPIAGSTQHVMVDVYRDGDSFDLSLVHAQYPVEIRRRLEGAALALPRFKKVFIGKGQEAKQYNLAFDGLTRQLISQNSAPGLYSGLMLGMDPGVVLKMANGKIADEGKSISFSGTKIRITQPNQIATSIADAKIRAGLAPVEKSFAGLEDWPGYEVELVDREELERTIVRGINRATEILAPGDSIKSPFLAPKQVENGRLEIIDGHAVAILRGTPSQIGKAHGELLGYQIEKCIDSVLHAFGLAQTVSTGKWFRKELESAFAQLEPHIPQRFREENRALALAIKQPPELIDALNVFPELFHCSGFALFGSATKDGKLYHGRVLDYMTMIGLQTAAVTFVIVPDGQTPFVSVGYGGFTGCVTGMNAKKISLGEMGGEGEGKWAGVPMGTLMRMALEQCSTLDDVIKLWKDSPRTCEYYYVLADGNSNSAVAVAATPEAIEFVGPGETHAKLGEGIQDAVVLSEGDRLKSLRNRVLEQKGSIDFQSAIGLMAKPVAMDANLHNVLFVPADGILYVANASYDKPADEMPYVKLDLNELLALPPGQAPEE